MTRINSIREQLRDVLEANAKDAQVAGAIVGVDVGGERTVVAYGSANLNTAQQFTEDTGFLLGGVPMTMALLLRLVDRGVVDLDERVSSYVPEFTLRDSDAAGEITVRMLATHTSGLCSETGAPSAVRGRDAHKSFVEELATLRGVVVFDPGAFLHYSTPSMVLIGRIIEEKTGLAFEQALEREILGPFGMTDSTAIHTQGFLRRTAIGATVNPVTGELEATTEFSLPESMGSGGGIPIVTAGDMLTLGRIHLAGGKTADGTEVLSAEIVKAAIETPSFQVDLPQVSPIGLGWWLTPIAGTTAPWMGGGPPGSATNYCLLPEHDAVIVSWVSGGGLVQVNDLLHTTAIEAITGKTVTAPFDIAPAPFDDSIAGHYASVGMRTRIEVDGDALLVTSGGAPIDADPAAAASEPPSGEAPDPYKSAGPNLFVRAAADPSYFGGFLGRLAPLATLQSGPGRPVGVHQGYRFTPKVS